MIDLRSPGLQENLVHFLDTRSTLAGLGTCSRRWCLEAQSETLWEMRCRRRFAIAQVQAVEGWLRMFRNYTIGLQWNTDVTPEEATYTGHRVLKNSSWPDVTFAIGHRGFQDGQISWAVKVHHFSDELRVGFTDNWPMLLQREHMSFHDPHAFLLSDGSSVTGLWVRGRQQLKNYTFAMPTPFRPGDVVGVELDFPSNQAQFYVNGNLEVRLRGLPRHAGAAGEHGGGPFRPLWPVVVLDEAGDCVELIPHRITS